MNISLMVENLIWIKIWMKCKNFNKQNLFFFLLNIDFICSIPCFCIYKFRYTNIYFPPNTNKKVTLTLHNQIFATLRQWFSLCKKKRRKKQTNLLLCVYLTFTIIPLNSFMPFDNFCMIMKLSKCIWWHFANKISNFLSMRIIYLKSKQFIKYRMDI
jgi:hypothetical protein